MSLVPITTQIGTPQVDSQGEVKLVAVWTERMLAHQQTLLQECIDLVKDSINIVFSRDYELDTLPSTMKHFVIPFMRDDLVRKIRARFGKARLYLPRAIIEARSCYHVHLPARSIAVSFSMYKCRVFLTQSCDEQRTRDKINMMCGTIVSSFHDKLLNLVITDRADDKYAARAMKRNIPVVSKDWLEAAFQIALKEDENNFNYDALTTAKEGHIKPFYGLSFKLEVKDYGAAIKRLIIENQGKIIYGDENSLTHVVARSDEANEYSEFGSTVSNGTSRKPKVVDVDFLQVCARAGYYMTKTEYQEYKTPVPAVTIKQERMSPQDYVEENFTTTRPTSGHAVRNNQNQAMLPPPSLSRPSRQQNNDMNDVILRALSFDSELTQHASTQMRRLPDPELRFEQTFEPSQQLYWNDRNL